MKEIEDIEGTRIGNFAISYIPEFMVSMWDGEKWIEQKLDPNVHIDMLYSVLVSARIWHGFDSPIGFPGLRSFIDEQLGDESE